MVRLNDAEMAAVMDACRSLPVEERDGFLRLLAAELGKHHDLCRAIQESQQRHSHDPRPDMDTVPSETGAQGGCCKNDRAASRGGNRAQT